VTQPSNGGATLASKWSPQGLWKTFAFLSPMLLTHGRDEESQCP
jgi:hypothetical protein